MADNSDPMGLQWAGTATGAAGALRQIIMDRIAEHERQRTSGLEERRMILQEQEAAAREADRQAALNERMRTEKDTAAGKAAPTLKGTLISPESYKRTFSGTSSEDLFKPTQSLAATQTAGAMPLDQTAPSAAVTRQAPRTLTGYTGTGTADQQKADEEDAQVKAALADPNTPAPIKGFLRVRSMVPKGEPVPPQLFVQPENANAEDRKYESIVSRQKQKLPVGPDEIAWSQAYEKRKTLGPAASGANSDQRLADMQDFQMKQAGRKELTDNVEKPYRDAQNSASMLRDVVASAQAGNQFAAAQQSLEGALATIRAQGLNRVNTTELGVSANAGSLWQRIQGSLGKQTSGQPMTPQLQKDLTDYADVLEKVAYKRYTSGHQSITKRYGLADEKPLAAPSTGASSTGAKQVRYDANGDPIK